MKTWKVLLAVAALAILIDLGTFHGRHHGDTIVPVLSSLYRWTFFYWEQNRYGMLVPLIASPLESPFHNLLLQNGLTIFFGLATIFLLARLASDKDELWPAIGALAAVLFFVTQKPDNEFRYLTVSLPFGTSLFFGLGALSLIAGARKVLSPRLLLIALCLFCSLWVNMATIFFLVPFLLIHKLYPGRQVPTPSWSQTGTYLGISLLIFGLIYAVSARYPYHYAYFLLSPGQWISHTLEFLRQAWRVYLADGLLLAALAIFAGGLACRFWLPDLSTSKARPRTAVGLLCGGIVYFGAFSVLEWTKGGHRLALPTILIIYVTLLSWGLLSIFHRLPEKIRRRLNLAAFGVLALTVVASYGLVPSPSQVRADLDRRLGSATPEVLASGATHVIGSYWNIGPIMYHANLTLYERGSSRRVWGIGRRSLPTADLWGATPVCEMVFAVKADDDDFAWISHFTQLPEREETTRLETISVLRSRCDDGPGDAALDGQEHPS